MALKPEYEKAYSTFIIIGIVILAMNIYYFTYSFWSGLGITHPVVVKMFLRLRGGGFFDTSFHTKGLALVLSMLTVLTRHGRGHEAKWWQIGAVTGTGLLIYFIPVSNPLLYILAAVAGYIATVAGVALAVYKVGGFIKEKNDMNETFEQCEKLVETSASINLPSRYQYKGKIRNGWVNFVNPFRGTLVLGTPGSGKSFSVFTPFMEQMVQKGYTMFVYDFKYPALTKDMYNIFIQNRGRYEELGIKTPKFCVVNFKDPRYSLRCNPLNPKYIKNLTDCTEIADVIMKNLVENDKKDYFTQSAQLFIDCGASFLWIYDDGRYCSFPHLIEFLSRPAEQVIEVLSYYPQLQTKVASFKEAWKKQAKEQLAGQTTSATVPIAGLSSPALYWVLSGDDFSLDISNREEPKIVCVGNDPSNQATYGSAMALIFGTLFKLINSRGNLKSAILLDEAPTVVIKGLDTLIATARSNEVAVVLGGQDKTQFVRDYGEKYANVIFNTVGNIISGQVNGRTAEEMSKMFGREFREKRSQTVSDDNESLQISFAQEELMPVSKIETLSQGTFFGKVADDFDAKIDRKLFCGEIVVDLEKEKERKKSSRPLPQMTSFGEERIWQSIREGELGKAAMRSLATDILNRKGIHDSITDSDISKVLEGISEREIREYLKTFGETYIDLTVKRAVEDNYQKIRRDIQSIFEAHGITDDGEGDDAGQSQPERNTDGSDRPEEKPSPDGNAGEEKEVDDGIHEEEAPDDGGGEQVEDETYIE